MGKSSILVLSVAKTNDTPVMWPWVRTKAARRSTSEFHTQTSMASSFQRVLSMKPILRFSQIYFQQDVSVSQISPVVRKVSV